MQSPDRMHVASLDLVAWDLTANAEKVISLDKKRDNKKA